MISARTRACTLHRTAVSPLVGQESVESRADRRSAQGTTLATVTHMVVPWALRRPDTLTQWANTHFPLLRWLFEGILWHCYTQITRLFHESEAWTTIRHCLKTTGLLNLTWRLVIVKTTMTSSHYVLTCHKNPLSLRYMLLWQQLHQLLVCFSTLYHPQQ